MRKRGDISTLWFLISVTAAVFAGYTIVSVYVANTQQGAIFGKLNTAKDIAMQINALAGVPGDAYIVNTNLHGYSLHFSGNKVEVFDEASFEKGAYYFVDTGSELNIDFDKPQQIVISKKGSEIKVSEEIPDLG